MAGNNEIREEYMSSLADLTFNSKPLISVLTILAEENIAHAKDIVEAIETHLSRVNIKVKLPVLYLIDCIIKNVGRNYTTLFCQNIVATFCGVFEQVDERTRAEMFKLRQTWNDVIPLKKLYALDVQIAQLDPAWPVTAPSPNSIHFNPKFLKTTSTTVTSTMPAVTKTQANPLITSTNTNSLDTKTLTMQQKLITKQRELLELQQRKLELELLQTQVKLQEQLKTNTGGGGSTGPTNLGSSQNMLLKPEVAKQLSQANTTTDGVVRNTKSKNLSHTLNARSQNTTGSTRTGPVNTRTTRDPRLMRHLQQQAIHQQQQQQQQHHENVSTTINSVLVENKLKAGNQVSLDSENKIVNNKANVRNDRIEHRLVNNKGNIESHGKSKTSPNSSSPLKHTQKIGGSRKNVKSKLFSSNDPTTNLAQTKSSDIKNKSDTKNTSRSNLKFKKKISSSNTSSSNNNGSSICTMRSEKDAGTSSRLTKDAPPASSSLDKNSNLGRYDKSDSSTKNGGEKKSSDKHSNKSIKSGKDKPHHKSDSAFFKDLKGSTKNRNYIRRNQNAPPPLCASPEPNQDVDLRVVGLAEKQPRLPGDIIDDKNAISEPTSQPMDVDLRQIPATIVAGKKRPSMDNSDSPNAKKSKSEVFDVLFGREDTDLRQLPSVISERPQTPPPPIISEKVITIRDDEPSDAMEVDKAKVSNFNAIRAKLANAVIQESEELQHNKRLALDMDMRRLSDSSHEQILISEDDEAVIRANKMTIDQQKSIANKIVTQIETQKLREAQRKESESMSNTSLQPISDDEFEAEFEFSSSDSDNAKKDGNYKKKIKTKRDLLRNANESRIPPLIPQNQLDDAYNKFNRTGDFRDPRRGRNWRGGRHRQKVWETNPPPQPPHFVHPLRPPNEQWARPPVNDAWRPNPFDGRPSNISPHLLDQRSQSPNNSQILQFVHPDSYKFITIDNEPREIRYYDETAIVFLSAGDPRDISFQNGMRRISFDGEIFELHFNEPYQEISIRGRIHRVRLGGPSREIFIDGRGYQCYFDNMENTIDLDGNTIVVKLEPPPPQVSIGQEKRLDLVAGKIQLIVDAKNMFTVFLDSKVQTFEVDGMKHSLKFIERLRAVLIDDVRFEVEYGGLPKPIKLQNRKYFIRFSVLPEGINPGQVALKDMDSTFQRENENSQEGTSVRQSRFNPILERLSPSRNSNSPTFFQNFIRNPNLDMLSSVMASSLTPNASESSYKVENDDAPKLEQPVVPAVAQELKPGLNINELFQRLVATGIVGTANKPQMPEPVMVRPTPPPPIQKVVTKNFVPIYFDKPETLKSRHSLRFSVLTMGMQCSSCGMRFPPEDTIRYSQHLDWHFRQNRKGKKNLRAAPGRPWYYSKSDWNNYTEIEDLEEREKSYFENQSQNQMEGSKEEVDEEEEIPCVAADPNVQVAICDVCHDRFEQFFNEETEEWQLRKAIRVDDHVYHPLCYEDYQAALEKSISEEENVTIPGLETANDDVVNDEKKEEEDEVMEVIDNIDDESPSPNENEQAKEQEEEEEEVGEEEEDDDVILNEVVPEKIVVDDDDKDDYVVSDHGLIPGVVVKVEPIDDGFVDVEDGVLKLKSDEIKIKSEPGTEDEMDTSQALDLGDDILEVREVPEHVPTTHTEVVSSIDGNLEFESGVTPASTGLNTKIKINITKPLPVVVPKDTKDVSNDELKNEIVDPSQPLPPGEEPVQLNLKSSLRGVSLKRQPVVRKGVELSGLCSIM